MTSLLGLHSHFILLCDIDNCIKATFMIISQQETIEKAISRLEEMAKKKIRVEIPRATEAQVQFASDRTCCVCRIKGKPFQIHHIDENPANNDPKNLAVLCLECHNETQIRGGFGRKLNADQVTLYRDDWLIQVAKTRAVDVNRLPTTDREDQLINVELATSLAEIYREREEYELLALHYLGIGNDELRDKYVELAIKQGMDDEGIIFFRSVQGRLDLIPEDVKKGEIKRLEKHRAWFSLGRLYRQLEEYELATKATCKGVIESIEEGNIFSAAFHLKEMFREGTLDALFIDALHDAEEEGDLWWQYRCLEELEWEEEANNFLLDHQDEIEELDTPEFNEVLTAALGDKERYVELRKEEAQSISAKPTLED